VAGKSNDRLSIRRTSKLTERLQQWRKRFSGTVILNYQNQWFSSRSLE
jgi:hypothetical protein